MTKKTEQMKTRKFTKKLAGVVLIGFVGMNTSSAPGGIEGG
jgi:hypothetical protein